MLQFHPFVSTDPNNGPFYSLSTTGVQVIATRSDLCAIKRLKIATECVRDLVKLILVKIGYGGLILGLPHF